MLPRVWGLYTVHESIVLKQWVWPRDWGGHDALGVATCYQPNNGRLSGIAGSRIIGGCTRLVGLKPSRAPSDHSSGTASGTA